MSAQYIAIDLGAGSGRILLIDPSGSSREFCRFATGKLQCANRLCWDHTAIREAVFRGVHELAGVLTEAPLGISCDSWAQDFVMLDKAGEVLTAPVCYLDGQLKGAGERLAARGLPQLPDISTACQLTVLDKPLLNQCSYILNIADWINYELSGSIAANYSMYSAGKLLDEQNHLHEALLSDMDIPGSIFPEMVSCQVIGNIKKDFPAILQNVPVISGISHDSAAAFYALAPKLNEFAMILGTWLMCAVIAPSQDECCKKAAKVIGITPESSAVYAAAPGMWAQTQCINAWKAAGIFPGYAAFDSAVANSQYPGVFQAQWSEKPLLPEMVAAACTAGGFAPPQTLGDIGRAINAGVASSVKNAFAELENTLGRPFAEFNAGGGGIRNQPLMDMLQKTLQCPCLLQTIEASGAGNALSQQKALQKA